MLLVISPAKSLDFSQVEIQEPVSQPLFLDEAGVLVNELRKYKPEHLSAMMGISAKLAELNYERFIKWHRPFNNKNAKAAIFAFKGDVYKSLDAKTLSPDEIRFASQNLRILSGLYGILAPLDIIQEYRLEMGTKLENPSGKNLYEFWDIKITTKINEAIKKSIGEKVLINLASNEYFKSIQKKHLNYETITPVFKDYKNGRYKIISFFAKKARGLMSRFIFQHKIENAEAIKAFDLDNYRFNQELSKGNEWVFTR